EEVKRVLSEVIIKGGIAAFPTETFYCLGARYDNVKALEKIHEIKSRPKDKGIPLIIGNAKILRFVTPSVTGLMKKLIERFWPGPLTLLLNAREDLPYLITAGIGKVAVRVPGASFALDLARALELPLTATSANISGMTAARNADEVIGYFGSSVDIIVDGGRTPGGMPSTIVEVINSRIVILRPGQVSAEELQLTVKKAQIMVNNTDVP
ncbi:MAG TPA: threonylcarbamoyl-AMP synthase, partial [Nitrospiraceae bacterium]|nr:threonylcarbamoyl-AMP synthase [Nitrospiraceae bacterium]